MFIILIRKVALSVLLVFFHIHEPSWLDCCPAPPLPEKPCWSHRKFIHVLWEENPLGISPKCCQPGTQEHRKALLGHISCSQRPLKAQPCTRELSTPRHISIITGKPPRKTEFLIWLDLREGGGHGLDCVTMICGEQFHLKGVWGLF